MLDSTYYKEEILSQYIRTIMYPEYGPPLSIEKVTSIIDDNLTPQMCNTTLNKEISYFYFKWLSHCNN